MANSWTTTSATNYDNFVSAEGTAEVNYAADDSARMQTEIQSIDAANKTDGETTPHSDQTLADALASDEASFETSAATATAAYQGAMAQAAHDDGVAVAQAIDNFAHDGSAANYNTALTTAASALAAAQQAAALSYRNAIGPATATQETNDANALLAEVTSVVGADLTDAKAVDQQNDTAGKAESDDFDAEQKADAQAVETLASSNADGYAGAIAAFDGSYPSPWADQAAAQAKAEDTRDDAQASAQLTRDQSLADAQNTLEKSQADAWQIKFDADSQAAHDKIMADAQAADAESLGDASSIAALVAQNAYFATLPDTLAAFDWSTTPNPSILADYGDLFTVDDLEVVDAFLTAGASSSSAAGDQSSTPVYGQSWTLGATTYDFGGLTVTANGMQTLLNDNGPYDPPNPWSPSDFMNGVQAPSGGSGGTSLGGGYGLSGQPYIMPVSGPGSGQPSSGGSTAPPGPASDPMPETNPETRPFNEEENWDTDSEFDARFLDEIEQSWTNPTRKSGPVDDLPTVAFVGLPLPPPQSTDGLQARVDQNRAEDELRARSDRVLDWLFHGGASGTAGPPTAIAPDGQAHVLIFHIGEQKYTWRQMEDGRWDVVAMVGPKDATPEDWGPDRPKVWDADQYREITDPAERAAVNQVLGTITQKSAIRWINENLPDGVVKELEQTGAIVAILSGKAEVLLEAQKMAKEGKSDKEILAFLFADAVTDVAYDVATAGTAKVLGPMIGAVLQSKAAQKLLKQGGAAGKKFVDRLTKLSKTITEGGSRKLSPVEEKNIRDGLDELRKIAGEADEVVGKEMNGMIAELEKAATSSGTIKTPSSKLQRWAQGEGGYIDPQTNKWVESTELLEADHVYPKTHIEALPGFDKLSQEQKDFLLNYPGNFEPLPKSWNSSKKNRLADEWATTPMGRLASKDYIDALRERQQAFENFALSMIDLWTRE